MMRFGRVLLVSLLFLGPALAGCFGSDEDPLQASDLKVSPSNMVGGEFQQVTFEAEQDLSVFVPYLVIDPDSNFVQNGTVLDIKSGNSRDVTVLAPPRNDEMYFHIGEKGRDTWPLRDAGESWYTWTDNDGHERKALGVQTAPNPDNGSLAALVPSEARGDAVILKKVAVSRELSPAYTEDEGALHSTGIVSGRTVYNMLDRITDGTPEATSPDGVRGYRDRWVGQGNLAYEDAINFLTTEMESYGLEVERHRFQQAANPEAVNVCGYRYGTVFPDEWLVFGAHFDIAPLVAPSNPALGQPRGYGTRVGAYDNTVGTSMVLTVAAAMADFPSRRTMVFCLWSSEEEGARGSDSWTNDVPPDVLISNYVNLDMAGVNWPGGGLPANRVGPDGGGSYPADPDVWPMRVYIGPDIEEDVLNQPAMVALSQWIGSDALDVEEEAAVLIGNAKEDWEFKEQPPIIIYESTVARSDHRSFQDNLGTITVGFGGLVDGYDCYHQLCDTVEEMEYWMETEDATGTANLVGSLDVITWWAQYLFFHLDETPILNALE